ncbi:MAG TPA: hypothetical protein VMH40_15330 [Myxococcaceae bacterium]|nr:hypothetical protein [Myxococcaceae bacterium]
MSSYEELQTLIFAFRQEAPWSLEDAARRLHLGDPALAEAVEGLSKAGLLAAIPDEESGPRRFVYCPAAPELAELCERIAEALDHDPLHVFDLMNKHALERMRTSAARAFAGSFVLRRKKKDG